MLLCVEDQIHWPMPLNILFYNTEELNLKFIPISELANKLIDYYQTKTKTKFTFSYYHKPIDNIRNLNSQIDFELIKIT